MLLPSRPVAKQERPHTWQRACARYRLPSDIPNRGDESDLADDDDQPRLLARIRETLERSGGAALAGAPAETAAYRWLSHGFSDVEEIEDWLAARCFDPARAHELDRAGLTPEQAAARTTAGRGNYEDTIAFKIAAGDLSLEEARRIVTSDFWND